MRITTLTAAKHGVPERLARVLMEEAGLGASRKAVPWDAKDALCKVRRWSGWYISALNNRLVGRGSYQETIQVVESEISRASEMLGDLGVSHFSFHLHTPSAPYTENVEMRPEGAHPWCPPNAMMYCGGLLFPQSSKDDVEFAKAIWSWLSERLTPYSGSMRLSCRYLPLQPMPVMRSIITLAI